MANRLLKTIYITFHVARASVRMRNEDLEKIFICIKEFIKRVGAIPMAVGGVENHIHILATLPKDKALSDYVRTIKANSSRCTL